MKQNQTKLKKKKRVTETIILSLIVIASIVILLFIKMDISAKLLFIGFLIGHLNGYLHREISSWNERKFSKQNKIDKSGELK